MVNRVQLSGCISERSALRYTPAGLPAYDVVLQHTSSTVLEEGIARRVELEIKAVCIGTTAVKVQNFSLGTTATYGGFLAPSRNRKGIIFHITDVQTDF